MSHVVSRYYGNIIRNLISYYVIKYRFSLNEQFMQIAAVNQENNWTGAVTLSLKTGYFKQII